MSMLFDPQAYNTYMQTTDQVTDKTGINIISKFILGS